MNQNVIVSFFNWTDEDFEWFWDKSNDPTPYKFPAKAKPVRMQKYLADHFAKHLANRELFKMNKGLADPIRAELENRCFVDEESAHTSNTRLEMELLNQEEVVEEKTIEEKTTKRKAGRPAKQVAENLPEEEFAGLKK